MSAASRKMVGVLRRCVSAGYNLWVVVGIVLLGIVLGLLNNLRVYEERRVEIFGEVPTADDADASDMSDAGEGAAAPEQGEP